MARKVIMPCKKTLSDVTIINFRLLQRKFQKMTKKSEQFQHFGLKNDLLPRITAFPVASPL